MFLENGTYSILPINLVHSDIVTSWTAPMRYEPPNTIVVDDSSEYVQYLYNNKKKELRTTHEILAIMLAFEVVFCLTTARSDYFNSYMYTSEILDSI